MAGISPTTPGWELTFTSSIWANDLIDVLMSLRRVDPGMRIRQSPDGTNGFVVRRKELLSEHLGIVRYKHPFNSRGVNETANSSRLTCMPVPGSSRARPAR